MNICCDDFLHRWVSGLLFLGTRSCPTTGVLILRKVDAGVASLLLSISFGAGSGLSLIPLSLFPRTSFTVLLS